MLDKVLENKACHTVLFLEYLFDNRDRIWKMSMEESYRSNEPPDLPIEHNKWLRKIARCVLPEKDMAKVMLRLKSLQGMTSEEEASITTWMSRIKTQSLSIKVTGPKIKEHV